jgi:periplasmic divalent cation tolerance protein
VRMTVAASSSSSPSSQAPRICVVLVTVPDEEAGRALALEVVEAGLAACGNLVPGLTSVYRWDGQVRQDPECLVIFKTSASRVSDLKERVVETHPYEVPEVLALPVVEGHLPYLQWVQGEVERAESSE